MQWRAARRKPAGGNDYRRAYAAPLAAPPSVQPAAASACLSKSPMAERSFDKGWPVSRKRGVGDEEGVAGVPAKQEREEMTSARPLASRGGRPGACGMERTSGFADRFGVGRAASLV